MTYEEAIKVIESNRPTAGYTMLCEALDIAKEALEKQISKKPIRANRAVEKDGQLFMIDENEYWKCPICTLMMFHYEKIKNIAIIVVKQ